MCRSLAAILLIIVGPGVARADTTTLTIGVLVGVGERTATRWVPTANYLTERIPGYRFVIEPLDREELSGAVRRNQLDLILTNPGQYADLAATQGVVALATIQHAWRGKPHPAFGAVIFTRADRRDIVWLSQLKGKSFMAVSRNDFDGFQLAWWEFKAHDIDPFEDFSGLVFSGLPAEEIVNAVRNGSVDAATVRSGVLERMARAGAIQMQEFRILHPHVTPEYPLARSSDLYPEWPIARARGLPDPVAQRVAVALQTMPPGHPAARAGDYAGWTAPLDYRLVQELLRDLRLPPYDAAEKTTVANIVHQYWRGLIAGTVVLLLLGGFAAYMGRMNYRLRLAKQVLEREMANRRRAEEAVQCSERALRALHGITSENNLSFERRVQALLALGCKQFGMPVGILSRIEGENYEIVEVVPPGGPASKGERFPLGHYCCNSLRSSEPVCFDLSAGPERFTHPVGQRYGLEACLGIWVVVEDAVYGTVNFVGSRRDAPLADSDREILKLMAQWLGGEITRQRTETRMRKLSGALEQTADAVMIVDRAGLIEYVNPAFEKVTGYGREEVMGKNPRVLRSGRHGEGFSRRLWETILGGEAFHDTFINRRRDGLLYYEEKTITPIKDEQGAVTHFISTGKDVTKRKLAEERAQQRRAQLAHVQRVSAMGVMATSLAHELNQPLAAIVNYAQGCIRRLRAGEAHPVELLPALEHIAAEGERSGEIIRRVREFLRKGKPLRTRADINQIVRQAVDLAGPEARQKNVSLQIDLSAGLRPVLADSVQIEQVVLNLIHNAIEAIDESQRSRREVVVQTRTDPRNGVEVVVRDTGPGLPADGADRLFEAFFSTKAHGMGMGLSISRSIIEAHGYQLEAMPDRGGAAFRFVLPAVTGETLQ